MLERVLKFSLEHRFLVVMVTLLAAAAGGYSFTQLKIDAVPDITNNQVAINTSIPSLSPEEVEKQVAYIIETSLAGIPGLQETRSISRNGFCQIIAIFDDEIDPYFARQQITERIGEMRSMLPPGAEPSLGPMATGLGEVYMYAVAFAHPGGQGAEVIPGEPGWQPDGTYLTQEGEVLRTETERLAYLRTLQDWAIKPQLRGIPGLADVETLGGYEKQYQVRPDPRRLSSYGLTFDDLVAAVQRNNSSIGGGYIERNGEGLAVRADGRVRSLDAIAGLVIEVRNNAPIYIRDVADVAAGGELRAGTATMNGREVVGGTALMLVGANSRIVAKHVGDRIAAVPHGLPWQSDESGRDRFWIDRRWRRDHHRELSARIERNGPASGPGAYSTRARQDHSARSHAGAQRNGVRRSDHYYGVHSCPHAHGHRRKNVPAHGCNGHFRADGCVCTFAHVHTRARRHFPARHAGPPRNAIYAWRPGYLCAAA